MSGERLTIGTVVVIRLSHADPAEPSITGEIADLTGIGLTVRLPNRGMLMAPWQSIMTLQWTAFKASAEDGERRLKAL